MTAAEIFRDAEAACTINGRVDPECLAAYYRGVIQSLLDEYATISMLMNVDPQQ